MTTSPKLQKLFPFIFFLSLFLFTIVAFRNPGVDFRGYLGAALLVLRGGNPYDYAQLAPVLEEISGFQGNNPYFYPPWYCLVFLPLTFIPFRWAQILWIGINLTLFYISLEWLWEILDWKIESWFRWTIFTFANILFGYGCLVSENSGFVLLFALALTIRSIKRDQAALAGLGLILMATKPQTTIFAIIFLGLWALSQKPKIILWAMAWFTGLILITTVIFPKWWVFDMSNFGLGISYGLDGATAITGKRVAATIYDWLRYFWRFDGWRYYGGVLLIAACGIYLMVFTWRNYYDPRYIAAAATFLTLLITPYALQYDFVPLTLAFFLIVKCLPNLKRQTALVIAGLFLITIIVQFFAQLQYQAYWIVLCMAGAFYLAIKGWQNKEPIQMHLEPDPGVSP